jgi:glycosyltransferase involved in cell wall biosynthesis
MRVLYSFPHTLGKPGISTTAYHQVAELIRGGIEVDVVCTTLGRDLPGANRVVETLQLAGRRIPHRAMGVERAYAYHDHRAARAVERSRGKIDLVHCWPAGCLRTIAACRAIGIPSFREAPSAHTQTAYEVAAREAAAVGVPLPRDHHHRHDDRRLDRELREFAAVDFLLVPSAYVERTFLERGHSAHGIVRHRYGYDPASFPAPDGRVESAGPGLSAAFVGRGEPNKGLHHALQAWVDSGAAEHGRLVVCGEILPAYRERLAPLLAHPSVRELGFQADVAAVMRDADVLLLPSLTEGSALVTYEAQASGCALLVSEAAGAECQHLVQGLIHAPGDVGALSEHLRRLDCDPGLLRRLQEGALANSVRLTWSAAAAELARAYAQGLDRFDPDGAFQSEK